MPDTLHVETFSNLAHLGNVVPDGYDYYKKHVTPAADLSLPTAYFKWYNIFEAGHDITEAQDAETRAFLTDELARLNLKGELGFILLHRASHYLLLMPITWRNTNELWESVYVKDLDQSDGYTLTDFNGTHRGTYCVWELAPVWHERQAWVRFLSSKRDDEAKLTYINDRFTGYI